MSGSSKFLKIDQRIWLVIFITFLLFILVVMIGILSTPMWIELDCDDETFQFKGSILHVEEGLDDMPNFNDPTKRMDMNGKNYQGIGSGLCFFKEISDEEDYPPAQWDFLTSWCTLFRGLWRSSGIFVGFEIFSMVSIATSIGLLVLFFYKYFYWRAAYTAGGCLWCSHTTGAIIWLATIKFTFDDDCTDKNDGDDPPTICALDGPRLAVFVLVFLPFVMIPYFLVINYFHRRFS